jgi:mRNA interferase RelE/StbE
MKFRLQYSKRAVKELSKLDKPTAKLIISWLNKHVDGCNDPRFSGKALKGSLREYWRYRIGAYRVICSIQDDQLIVVVIEVGHRSGIYEN